MQQIENKSGPVLGYRAISLLSVALFMLQPILIGQYLYSGADDTMKDAHAGIGNLIHITVLLQVILAFVARRTFGIGLGILNVIILILVVIQGSLGFSDNGDAQAIHIPLGTFLLTLGVIAAFLGFFDVRRQRRLPQNPTT